MGNLEGHGNADAGMVSQDAGPRQQRPGLSPCALEAASSAIRFSQWLQCSTAFLIFRNRCSRPPGGQKGDIALAASCGPIITPRTKSQGYAPPHLVQPRFGPHCRTGLGRGRDLGMQHVSHQLCQEFGCQEFGCQAFACQGFVCQEFTRRYPSKFSSRRVLGPYRPCPKYLSIACRRSRGGVSCGLRSVHGGPKFRICGP